MNKKTMIVYTFLFLFVFTFALSFTLASKAQAEQGGDCCIYEWCYDSNPPWVSVWGHMDGPPHQPQHCMFIAYPYTCDVAYVCSE